MSLNKKLSSTAERPKDSKSCERKSMCQDLRFVLLPRCGKTGIQWTMTVFSGEII